MYVHGLILDSLVPLSNISLTVVSLLLEQAHMAILDFFPTMGV